jgi:aspartate kinase
VVLNNIIDKEFTVLDQTFYDYIAERLAEIIKSCENRVPVLTGIYHRPKTFYMSEKEGI